MLSKWLIGSHSDCTGLASYTELYRIPSLTNWFSRRQSLEALRLPIFFPPCSLFLKVMKQRNNISQATEQARSAPRLSRMAGQRYFCTSTFPNVTLSIKTSSSSFFAANANSMASTSSTPFSWPLANYSDRDYTEPYRICVYNNAVWCHLECHSIILKWVGLMG